MNAAVADNPDLPEQWSRTENVEWVTDIPGIGWSSPVVWGQRVFLTTVTADGEFEQPKPGLYAPNGRPEPPPIQHDWLVYCLDLESGDVLWQRSVMAGMPAFPRHMKNSYASETPTTDGERVYVRFGELGVYTFDMEGNEVWRLEIPDKRTRSEWGSASSPVLHGDKLILLYDNEEESWIAALDKRTGEEIWRTARDEVSSWATPYIWEHDQRTEIVTSGMNRIPLLRPRRQPAVGADGPDVVGRHRDPVLEPRARLCELRLLRRQPSARLRDPPRRERRHHAARRRIVERPRRLVSAAAGNYNTSPLIYGDIYYSLLDRGFFEAYDARTGDPVYGRQRVRVGASFTSSPWAYNGKIFALSEQGDTYVIRARARVRGHRRQQPRRHGDGLTRHRRRPPAHPHPHEGLQHQEVEVAVPHARGRACGTASRRRDPRDGLNMIQMYYILRGVSHSFQGRTRERVFQFVRDRLLAGDPPTVRDIQQVFGFRTPQTAR